MGRPIPNLVPRMTNRASACLGGLALLLVFGPLAAAKGDDWPQWLGPRRDGVWRETGILEKFPAGGPRIRWHADIGGGYAGPAVAKGRVYVTDRGLPRDAKNPRNPFARDRVRGQERVLCLDEANGKQVWSYKYDCP